LATKIGAVKRAQGPAAPQVVINERLQVALVDSRTDRVSREVPELKDKGPDMIPAEWRRRNCNY